MSTWSARGSFEFVAPPTHHGIFLDFLYPKQTFALLKRSSHNRPLPCTNQVCRYSTVPPQTLHADPNLDAKVLQQIKEEADTLIRTSDAITELKKLLRTGQVGKQELAWQLYDAIGVDLLVDQHELKCDLLEYFVADGIPAVPSRVVRVYTDLDPTARRPSSYQAAIVGYATSGLVGPAIKILEEIDSAKGFDMLHCGINAILRRTVLDEQWDLTFRVWRVFIRKYPKHRGQAVDRQIRFGEIFPEIWADVAQLPALVEHFQSFVRYLRAYTKELDRTPRIQRVGYRRDLRCFIMTFVPNVMHRVLHTKDPDEDFIWDWFVQTFDELNSMNLCTSACYEYAIKRMLEIPRYQQYTNKRKLWHTLYRAYRQRHLDSVKHGSKTRPSENLVRNMVNQYTEHHATRNTEEFINDLRLFYPTRPLRPGLLRRLIMYYARKGDAEKAQEYLKEFASNYPSELHLQLLTSLLYAYAKRRDVDGVIREFTRIHQEYQMTPDLSCWNILILTYLRADNLDGALECFNNCIEFGLVPDTYTFSPLLNFCASRGDIEAFEALFSKAKQMGVQLDSNVRARSAYVRAFLNAGDPEGAEAIALGMLKSWQNGTLYGEPLTHTWNLLIQEQALNRDLAGSRQYYKQMVQNGIPLDSWTFGSLMRSLVEVKQTNAAYKILRVAMPEQNIRVHAFHYAIVMSGFLKEKQYHLAMDAYERMKGRNVPETESARQASLRVLGEANIEKLKDREGKLPNYHLLKMGKALEEMLVSSVDTDSVHDQPRNQRGIDVHAYGSVPQHYYATVISLYSDRWSYRICKKLFKKAEELTPDTENYIRPLNLTTAMMEAHYKAGKHDEVAKCWELARESATKLTKTFNQVLQQPEPAPEIVSLHDPTIQQRFSQSRLASNRRHMLATPSRIYIRSLLAQKDPAALEKVKHTIYDLLVNGYLVDNFSWNEYIQHLAFHPGHLVEAFTLCEQYLMPRFPGWRTLHPNYIRHDRKGYQLMELRHYEIKKSSVMPRYKTLVVLAKAFGQVRQDERSGFGYDQEAQAWMAEILEQRAPDTVRAIETMPRTYDQLQERQFRMGL
ncbi:PPR-2 domain containing protein [Pyrenophora tritici-repentis]|nr:PPR-2 domain-containing protein [Pyrenophora tritici-repentis]KAI1668568.1 PPR-2 domain containing protein [Pyrenophora tritici-repentis]PZC91480.1 PPR-2 domain containing protein [Pyrenophora tritici-repentis]PZD25195.1 PPR-2 domain containing protein [Pyrenophora tritici-repentis]